MIQLAVFESDPLMRESIRKAILKYTIRQVTDFDVLWFYDDFNLEKIKNYISRVQIALICLDLKESERIGELISRHNEDCRIVFYSAECRELEPLLRFRPRGYHHIGDEENVLFEKMDGIVSELKNSHHYFYHETKREILLLPLSSIVYFQSDLKYVNIVLKNGKSERIYAKLSAIEPKLNPDFLRIHKSYIVNKTYVNAINKANKTLIVQNDERLPISEVNYKAVILSFDERND